MGLEIVKHLLNNRKTNYYNEFVIGRGSLRPDNCVVKEWAVF